MPTEADHHRRIRKFLQRSERALDSSLHALGKTAFQMTLQMEIDPETGQHRLKGLSRPDLPWSEIRETIIDCGPFFRAQEDAYLPGVVASFRALVPDARSRQLRDLRRYVLSSVDGGKLKGEFMFSGRIEADNGLGDGRLIGSDQAAMDYIYGRVIHEDEERLDRLENMDGDSIKHSVIMVVGYLLMVVKALRDQILYDREQGYLPEDPGRPRRPFDEEPRPAATNDADEEDANLNRG